jgi:hypothetical protein
MRIVIVRKRKMGEDDEKGEENEEEQEKGE